MVYAARKWMKTIVARVCRLYIPCYAASQRPWGPCSQHLPPRVWMRIVMLITAAANVHWVPMVPHSQYSQHFPTLMPPRSIIIWNDLTIDKSKLLSLVYLWSLLLLPLLAATRYWANMVGLVQHGVLSRARLLWPSQEPWNTGTYIISSSQMSMLRHRDIL